MKHPFSSQNTSKGDSYLLTYTLIFLLLSAIVFSPFLLNGKSLIWKPDGLTQHFNALIYFRSWVHSILRTLMTEHRLSIPLWDSTIGYGSDILTTLHYYVIGDPLNLLAIVVPARYLEALYEFLILLRLYLSGLAFSYYCFTRNWNQTGTLAGSLLYTFSGYCLILAPMHPYFINPLIYLPLLLVGIERILHQKNGQLFIAMTALCALSNFYFFYMLAIFTWLYWLIRSSTIKKTARIKLLGKMLFFFLTGVGISAVILLPILIQFLSDSRSNTTLTYPPLYGWSYYEQLLDQFISLNPSSNWTYLGFSTPALLAVFLLFLKPKRYLSWKISLLILTLFLLLPGAGSLLNGFSYAANRWSFAYVFLIAALVAFLWPELLSLSSKERSCLFLLLLLYGMLLFQLPTAGTSQSFFSLFLTLLTLSFLTQVPEHIFKYNITSQCLLFLLIAIHITTNALFFYKSNMENHLNRFVDAGKGFSALEHSASGMVKLFLHKPSTFSRYAQDLVPVRNDTLYEGTNSIHYYWSLSNGSITQFFNELALPFRERTFKYDNLDQRAQLHALAGVRWYIQHDPNKYLPYPFQNTQVFEYLEDLYYASESLYYLPFGYTCKNRISPEAYHALPYLKRQQALLQGIVCEAPLGIPDATLTFEDRQIPVNISYGANILEENGCYYALTDDAQLTLTFEGLPSCETYLLIEGLEAHSLTELELYTQEPTCKRMQKKWDSLSIYEQREKKRNHLYSPNISQFSFVCTSKILESSFCYYTGLTESSYDRSDFLLNMGYASEGQHTITIKLPYQGVYSFQNLSISCLSLQNLPDQVNTLGQEHLEQVHFGVNQIHGRITLTSPKLLCLSIPYSPGWTALDDSKPVPILQANTMYMSLPLEAGVHSIELHYCTPGLKTGLGITMVSLLCQLLYGIWYKRYRHS